MDSLPNYDAWLENEREGFWDEMEEPEVCDLCKCADCQCDRIYEEWKDREVRL